MKRVLCMFLAIVLCVGLTSCGDTGNETHDYILELLENEEYDMAIYVIEGLRDGAADPQQSVQDNTQTHDQIFELEPNTNGTDWMFHMDLMNHMDTTLTLESVVITDWMDGQQTGIYEFVGEDLNRLPMGQLVLEPDCGSGWEDGHPVVAHFNQREYRHIFRDAQGGQVSIIYVFDMRNMMPAESGSSENSSTEQPAGDWHFPILLHNTGDTPWKLSAMEITDFLNDQQLGIYTFEGDSLDMIGLGGIVLEPGQQMNWNDGHPVTTDWNCREYRFYFMDEKDQKQTLTFRFGDLDAQSESADYAQDDGKNLKTLRHDAYFEQEVHPGVYWVPAVILGVSRYSNMDIYGMRQTTPEEKQQNISTLYEALQLYQVGNFVPSDDNIRIFENGVNWEHHKPGYHAVRTNTGCCATDSNWLRYILDGDYEEVGFIATSQRDGSGHVYNYILHGGWYYLIDLTHYHASGSPMDSSVEDGDLNSYHSTDFILGNIHKVRDVQDYVDYVQQTFNDPPGLMFMYTAENVLAVDGASSPGGVQIIYEEANGQQINVIFDDPADSLSFVRSESPKNIPHWDQLPDAQF